MCNLLQFAIEMTQSMSNTLGISTSNVNALLNQFLLLSTSCKINSQKLRIFFFFFSSITFNVPHTFVFYLAAMSPAIWKKIYYKPQN